MRARSSRAAKPRWRSRPSSSDAHGTANRTAAQRSQKEFVILRRGPAVVSRHEHRPSCPLRRVAAVARCPRSFTRRRIRWPSRRRVRSPDRIRSPAATSRRTSRRVPAGESAERVWEGFPRSNGTRSLHHRPAVGAERHADRALHAARRCEPVRSVARADADRRARSSAIRRRRRTRGRISRCRTARAIPHMQRGGEAPILPDATSRWPVLAFSHGYGGSPLSDDHIEAVAVFASHGYIVVAPFHGDPRFALLSIRRPRAAL